MPYVRPSIHFVHRFVLYPSGWNPLWLMRLFAFFARNTHLLFSRLLDNDYENFMFNWDIERYNEAIARNNPNIPEAQEDDL